RTTLDNKLSLKAEKSLLDQKADITEVYSRSTIDTELGKKADKTDLALKADVSLLELKADITDIYTINQLYTKSEIDNVLSNMPTKTSIDLKANANDIYTIGQLYTKNELNQRLN
ncbi:hypothetical protein MHK_005984, partial [Candidatus Magnetomorum sp. HK-1]